MDWLRLWHDMPNDPKWRAIARRANLSIPEVMAVYMHMMVQASENDPRGSIEGWDDEDVAAALDIDVESVEAIRKAMQGKVLDGDKLRGWDKRQPSREDNSRERVRKHREKKAEESKKCNDQSNESEAKETGCNADVTQGNAPEEIREEEKREEKAKNTGSADADPSVDASLSKKFTDEDFDKFWIFCKKHWFGNHGHRHEARKEFDKLRPEKDDLHEILKLTRQECEYRRRVEAAEGFCENMKHVCRWIKVRGWDDTRDRIESGPALSLVGNQDSTQINKPHRPPMPKPDRAPMKPTGTGGDA